MSFVKDGKVKLFNRDVAPEIWIEADDTGDMEKFLDAISEVLDEVYQDAERLTKIQDPDQTPEEYLEYIAESFDWELLGTTEEERRLEARSIVPYYRLKGTEQGIKIISSPILKEYFQDVIRMNQLDFAWQMAGRHFEFDGTYSRAGVPYDDSLDLNDPFSMQLWVKLSSGKTSYIYDKYDEKAKTGYYLKINSTNQLPYIEFTVGDGDNTYSVTTEINIETWRKIFITLKDDKLVLYVNDILQDFTENVSVNNNENDFYIGALDGRSRVYYGYLDNMRIWNGEPENNANLVAWWSLNQEREVVNNG